MVVCGAIVVAPCIGAEDLTTKYLLDEQGVN